MFQDLTAVALTRFHDQSHGAPGWPAAGGRHTDAAPGDPWAWIEANHRYNSLLWAEEDLARRKNVPDAAIVANKRAIDGYNQKRNDATEKIDEVLLSRLAAVTPATGARLSSETAGSMIDRLSIMSLKIKAMREQTERTNADAAHIESCRTKLAKLLEQRADLAGCLESLLAEAAAGSAYYKIYRQFKMYNDPKLNPQLYKTGA
jgi:RNase H-fold protein (predicted Holliday junction resolvase)